METYIRSVSSYYNLDLSVRLSVCLSANYYSVYSLGGGTIRKNWTIISEIALQQILTIILQLIIHLCWLVSGWEPQWQGASINNRM